MDDGIIMNCAHRCKISNVYNTAVCSANHTWEVLYLYSCANAMALAKGLQLMQELVRSCHLVQFTSDH